MQVAVRERARGSVLSFPAQRNAVLHGGALPLVEQVVHDIHGAPDAPGRALDAGREVDDLLIVFVEFDVQVLEHGLPEPAHVGRGPVSEGRQVREVVSVHEAPQVGTSDHVGVRGPDHFLVEGERGRGRRSIGRHGGETRAAGERKETTEKGLHNNPHVGIDATAPVWIYPRNVCVTYLLCMKERCPRGLGGTQSPSADV